MPEGHSIHRLARDHSRWFKGQTIETSSPQGRFTSGAQAIDGAQFGRAFAHGKHLFYECIQSHCEPLFVHIHLGLYGRFKRHKKPIPSPTPNVRLRLIGHDMAIDLSGPTCCEILDESGVSDIERRLGPDPLIEQHTADDCMTSFSKRRKAIGAVLLDQKAISGLGNIFRCELLFVHGIDPYTPANQLKEDTVRALYTSAQEWLSLGVKANRILTTLPAGTTRLPRPLPKEKVAIYKKKACPVCSQPISSIMMANRTLYACMKCQVKTA